MASRNAENPREAALPWQASFLTGNLLGDSGQKIEILLRRGKLRLDPLQTLRHPNEDQAAMESPQLIKLIPPCLKIESPPQHAASNAVLIEKRL